MIKKKIVISVVLLLLVTGQVLGRIEDTKGNIYIPCVVLSNGTQIHSVYNERKSVLKMSAQKPSISVGDFDTKNEIDVVIYKDGVEVARATFDTFNNQLRFDFNDYEKGEYEIYTVADEENVFIGYVGNK